VPTRLLFEGPDIQTVLTRVYRELGDDVDIVKADKVMVGGIAGFFAKVRYEVVVQVSGQVRAPRGAREVGAQSALAPAAVAASAAVAQPVPVAQPVSQPVVSQPAVAPAAVAAPAPAPVAAQQAAPATQAAAPAVRVLKASAPAASPTSITVPATTLEELAALADRADTAELMAASVPVSVGADAAGGPPPAPIDDPVRRGPDLPAAPEPDEFAAVFSQFTDGVIDFDTLPPAPIEPPASFHPMYGAPRIVEPGDARRSAAGARFAAETQPAAEIPAVFRRPAPPEPMVQPVPPVRPAPVQAAPVPEPSAAPGVVPAPVADGPSTHLRALGLPEHLAVAVGSANPHADLVEAFKTLPVAPSLPRRPGDVIVVVGDVASALPAARALAKKMRIDPAKILLAADTAAGTGVHGARRITGPADAERRARRMHRADVAHIVVVDAPLDGGEGAEWAEEIADAVGATQVWAVVDATRKVGDIADQLARLGGVDALVVDRADVTRDPAGILELGLPVAVLDGRSATPRAWADLIAGRLGQDAAAVAPRRRGRRS
jgi:hypothetical protein